MKRLASLFLVLVLVFLFTPVLSSIPTANALSVGVVLSPEAEPNDYNEKSFNLYTVIGGVKDNGAEVEFAEIKDLMVTSSALKDENGKIIDYKMNHKFNGKRSPVLHELKPDQFKNRNKLIHEVTVSGKLRGPTDIIAEPKTASGKTYIYWKDHIKIKMTPEIKEDKVILHLTTEGQKEKPVGNWRVSLSGSMPDQFEPIIKSVQNRTSATVEFTQSEIFGQMIKKKKNGNDYDSLHESEQRKKMYELIQQSKKKIEVVFQGSGKVRNKDQTYNLYLYASDLVKTFVKFEDLLPKPKPDPKPDPKPNPKPNPKPDPRPNPQPNPKPEPKPEPNPTPKPKPHPDPKPPIPDLEPNPPNKVKLNVEACFDLDGKLMIHATLPKNHQLKGDWVASIGEKEFRVKEKEQAKFTIDSSNIKTEDGKFPLTVVYKANKGGIEYKGNWRKELVQIEVKNAPQVKDGKVTFQASLKNIENVEDGSWKISYDGKTEEKAGDEKLTITLDSSSDQNNPQGTTDFETGKKIKIEFSGKVDGKEVESCLQDTIQPVPNQDDEEPSKESKIENHQTPNVPNQQAGGKLPKTATAYAMNLWIGAWLMIMGISIFRWHRRYGR